MTVYDHLDEEETRPLAVVGKRRHPIRRILIAGAISAALLAVLLWKLDWVRFLSLIRAARPVPLVVGAGLLFIANLIRAMRFKLLDPHRQPLLQWWILTQIYNLMTSTLPGGMGEAATAVLLRRTTRADLLESLQVLIITRVMDLAALTGLLLAAAVAIPEVGTSHVGGVALGVGGGLFILALAILIPAVQRLCFAAIRRLYPSRFWFARQVQHTLHRLSESARYGGVGRALGAGITTCLVQGLAAAATYCMVLGLGAQLGFWQSVFCFGIFILFQLVPVQGIAGLGTQDAAWALALQAAGYRGADPIALGFLLHATTFLAIAAAAGLAGVVWLFAGFGRPAGARASVAPPAYAARAASFARPGPLDLADQPTLRPRSVNAAPQPAVRTQTWHIADQPTMPVPTVAPPTWSPEEPFTPPALPPHFADRRLE